MTPERELKYWKTVAKVRGETIVALCNMAWGAVYGEHRKTQWDYPAQAIRHLVQAYQEARCRPTS